MLSPMPKLNLLLFIAIASSHTPIGRVFAQDCRGLGITIRNKTDSVVTIKSFEYHISDKGWKSENELLGLSGRQDLRAGHGSQWIGTLSDAGGKRTRLRITYVHQRNKVSSDEYITETTEPFICSEGINRTVALVK